MGFDAVLVMQPHKVAKKLIQVAQQDAVWLEVNQTQLFHPGFHLVLINLSFDLFDELRKGQGDGIWLHLKQKQKVGIYSLLHENIGDSLPKARDFGKEILKMRVNTPAALGAKDL